LVRSWSLIRRSKKAPKDPARKPAKQKGIQK
jgi:hypothetical protein